MTSDTQTEVREIPTDQQTILVEALAEQAVATHALDEALARQTAKIQLIKTFGRG